MSTIIEKGYAEKIDDSEFIETGKKWYIPHHGVYHPRKPDKIRVVFDCSSTFQGTSLNKQLLSGPDLTNTLIGCILRFRQESVAIVVDIEKMFYQVVVPPEDRNLLRFFWWPDGDTQRDPEIFRMTVHLFGAVSSPSCSNWALKKTAEDHSDTFEPEIVEMVKKNFYVDDFLVSVPTEERAIEVREQVTELLQLGGFRLTQWMSSSHTVVDTIPTEDRAKGVRDLDLQHDQLPVSRALGVFWDVEQDSFGFRVELKDQPATRRGILSTVSSVYDPIGFLGPFILREKSLLQELCGSKLDWDDSISKEHHVKWSQWLAELQYLEDLKIPRSYKPKNFRSVTKCDLHMFSDASDVGYGIVAYLVMTDDNFKQQSTFVFAKSRVAPLKKVTVPRMELTAATVAVRMSKIIQRELQYTISDVFYWTDSMSVLRYIANESARFHTFVANRVNVIRDGSNIDHWRYIDTKSNPADVASRGCKLHKLLSQSQWFQGPNILAQSVSELKQCKPEETLLLQEGDPEVKNVVNCAVKVVSDPIEKLVNHYSSWNKLKQAVGWFIVLRNKLLKQVWIKKGVCENRKSNPLLSDDSITSAVLKEAEKSIIRYVQRHHYLDLILDLEQRAPFTKLRKSTLQKLDPFIQDGLLRVGGRLEEASMTFEMKHPAILPTDSPVSMLILRNIHETVGHLGKNMILSVLRQKYWIVGATTAIKRLMSKCVLCKKYQAKVIEQKMSDLPKTRLSPDDPPFSHVGVDYFGPILVRRARTTVKRYVLQVEQFILK